MGGSRRMRTEKFPAFLREWDDMKTSESGRAYQRIVVETPPRKDDFGNVTAPGDTFEIMIYGGNEIDAFWKSYKAEATEHPLNFICYVNSRKREHDGKNYYNASLTLKSYEWKYKPAKNG